MSQPEAQRQQAKSKSKQRDPPPTLFLHPSPAASHVSIPGIVAASVGSHAQVGNALAPQQSSGISSLQRTTSLVGRSDAAGTASVTASVTSPITEGRRAAHAGHQHAIRAANPSSMPLNLGLPLHPQLRHGESTRATDRTDALWAEMQATLEEVELSASGGTRVFGPDHDRKLGELRVAQIALAQAWARSEADDAIETTLSAADGEAKNPKAYGAGAGESAGRAAAGGDASGGKPDAGGTDAAKSTAGTGSARPGSSGLGADRLGAKLEEETEVDILLARKRREANDRYFQRVNQGVLDVVAKLEEVAIAMRAVEQESKDIWGENENEAGNENDNDNQSIAGSAKT